MKKLLNAKLIKWFQSIDSLCKIADKSSKQSNHKVLNVVNEYKTDSSILSCLNNIFVELIYSFHHPFDDRTSLDVIESVCSNLCKLYIFPDRKVTLIALDILPSFLFAYLCICNSQSSDTVIPKRQRSRRRSSSISPFNESRKSLNSQHLDQFSIIDILEFHLLRLYNHELDKDILCHCSEQEFRFPNPMESSIYSNAIFNLQISGLDSLSRESYSQSSTSLLPNTIPMAMTVFPSNNSLEVNKSIENDSVTEIGATCNRDYLLIVTSDSRCNIIRYLLNLYLENIVEVSQSSLMSMTKLIVHIHPERQQIAFPPRQGRKATNLQLPRVPELGVQVYLEMASIAYYALFNSLSARAIDAVNALEARANLEFCFEVLLVTNAIKNSLECNPVMQSPNSSLGVNSSSNGYVITSMLSFNDNSLLTDGYHVGSHDDTINNDNEHLPTYTSPSKPTLRSIITNASFRTVKLPDDIPIVESSGPSSAPNKNPNSKLTFNKASKTPRFKFEFRGSDKFEGIKECVYQEQCLSATGPGHSIFQGKSVVIFLVVIIVRYIIN